MKALTWHGRRDVRVDDVPDPTIEESTDAIVRVTSTAICGSDLHLYEVLGPFIDEGDILGHEPMGIVEEVGPTVTHIKRRRPRRDPVQHLLRALLDVRPRAPRHSARRPRCASTTRAPRSSATRSSTARFRAARPSYLRVPQAHFGPIKVPDGPPDERFLFLSDVLPTAWQAVEYADVPAGGSVAVFGLGPIGQMSARIAKHQGAGGSSAVDLVPERLEMARRHGVEVIDADEHDDVAGPSRERTGRPRSGLGDRRGRHGGARRRGAPRLAQKSVGLLPDCRRRGR